jgi:ATP-dependent RNA helicase DHX29
MIEDLRQQYFSLLCDIGFVKPSKAEKSPRLGKSRVKFVRVPDELDTHSRDPKIVMAAIAASMYPKLLVVDPFSSQMKTLSNSAPASIHPSSVNFTPGQRINFDGAKFIVYFTAMQTKKLCKCIQHYLIL